MDVVLHQGRRNGPPDFRRALRGRGGSRHPYRASAGAVSGNGWIRAHVFDERTEGSHDHNDTTIFYLCHHTDNHMENTWLIYLARFPVV